MHNSRTEFPKALGYTRESFGHRRILNFDAKVRKTAQNYENYRNWNGDQGVQFRTHQSMEEEEEDSGVCSPPLWNNVPQENLSNRPLLHHSRVQDIVRGQGELMDMIKNLPESSYELTLKDLVEPSILETQDQDQGQEEGSDKLITNHDDQVVDQMVKVKRQESMVKEKRAKMIRNGSIDNRGLFLKMVFPITFKSKKKKNLTNNASSKVSPKPEVSSKGADKEWWKKRFTYSSNSDNSRTSNSNGSKGSSSGDSYGSRRKNGFLSSCWSCFHSM
ncbi:uncharacterized protein LOC111372279 [Olea europaea var. sylvestris]|uniref:uncharacterized protein LOC111372279 n=1 Tax=Olea europaea var. sylvestris TaxID=158386 RepID=UPI000C1D8295|nr:uncharacterized protein LOC111372279 [Olea europaea var. sylvestris]